MIVGTTSAQSPGLSEGVAHTSMVLLANEHAAGERSYRVARAATGLGEVIPIRRGGWRNGPLARPKRAQLSLSEESSVPRVEIKQNLTPPSKKP